MNLVAFGIEADFTHLLRIGVEATDAEPLDGVRFAADALRGILFQTHVPSAFGDVQVAAALPTLGADLPCGAAPSQELTSLGAAGNGRGARVRCAVFVGTTGLTGEELAVDLVLCRTAPVEANPGTTIGVLSANIAPRVARGGSGAAQIGLLVRPEILAVLAAAVRVEALGVASFTERDTTGAKRLTRTLAIVAAALGVVRALGSGWLAKRTVTRTRAVHATQRATLRRARAVRTDTSTDALVRTAFDAIAAVETLDPTATFVVGLTLGIEGKTLDWIPDVAIPDVAVPGVAIPAVPCDVQVTIPITTAVTVTSRASVPTSSGVSAVDEEGQCGAGRHGEEESGTRGDHDKPFSRETIVRGRRAHYL